MTNTRTPATTISRLDFRFLVALADAYAASLDAEMSYNHDRDTCGITVNDCFCFAASGHAADAYHHAKARLFSEEQILALGLAGVVGRLDERLFEMGVRVR